MVVYVSHPDFESELLAELPRGAVHCGRIFLSEKRGLREPLWAQDTWQNVRMIVGQKPASAISMLRESGRHFFHVPGLRNPLAQSIEEALPSIKQKPLHFLESIPSRSNVVQWSVIDANRIVYSSQTTCPIPGGAIAFVPDQRPPNRAYLKLWELMTVHKIEPRPNDLCLDLGAAPGGWTWVLQSLGCRVVAIDRAPLAPHVAKLKGVQWQQGDAFALNPKDVGPVDWVFSDVICEPLALRKLIDRWIESGLCKNMVCTIKLKGEPNPRAIEPFLAIPGSQVRHLWHNKHELTWAWNQTKV